MMLSRHDWIEFILCTICCIRAFSGKDYALGVVFVSLTVITLIMSIKDNPKDDE